MTNQADVKTKARPEPSVEPDQSEFAIICALPREFDAVETSLDEIYDSKITPQNEFDSNFYKKGRIGPFHVVVACLPEMGKESAASAASNLRISFPNIGLTFVVGICGGVPYPSGNSGVEMIMGDVIISHQVIKFDFGRQYPDRFEQRGGVQDTLDRSNRSIRSLISGLQTRSTNLEFQEMHEASQSGDVEVSPIQRERLVSGDNPIPRLHFGPIASSDTVMKSGKHRDELVQKSQVIGFEMEGSGVCNHLSCVIIKGVCDYADGHKTKIWQDYAAASAASATKSVLELLATKRFGSFAYCKTVQTSSTATSVTSISDSSSREWRISPIYSESSDIDQHIQSVSEGLHRMAEEIPDLLMRRTLVSAASGVIKSNSAQIQSLPKNKIFQSEPYETLFGKVILRTQMIEHTISVADESNVQTETQSSFIFHPAPWLLRLGIRYGLKAMAINHHRTWQYSVSPINVRPDESFVFRLCEMGDTAAVRELFIRQQASVYDVDTNGTSLLHIAARFGHFDLSKFLILQNADKEASVYKTFCRDHFTPASYLALCLNANTWPQMFSLFRNYIEFSDENSDGWHFLTALENSQRNLKMRDYDPHFFQDWLSFLLHRFREDAPASISYRAIECAIRCAGRRKDLDSIKLILKFDTQRVVYGCSSYIDHRSRFNAAFFILQALAEEGYDIRGRLHGDTPTSRSLRFSGLFSFWREDVRLFYPDLDDLIDVETNQGHDAPSLRGWSCHVLKDLFSLELVQPSQRYGKSIYSDLERSIVCMECGYSCLPCDFDSFESGFMIEPWWEGVKCSVQNRECLWFLDGLVYDGRDQDEVIHKPSCFEDSDPDSNSENGGLAKTCDHLEDVPSTETQNVELQTVLEEGYSSSNSSGSIPGSSDCLDDTPDLPAQSEDPSTHRWDEINHFTFWAKQCYMKYGGWKFQYQRDEYICFLCLASKEGWAEEYEEVCRYWELSEESKGPPGKKSGEDEPDSGPD